MQLNTGAVSLYLSYKHVPYPMTAVKGQRRRAIYYRPPRFGPPLNIDEGCAAEVLDFMLRGGIDDCLVKLLGNQPAVLLSGGIDSGIIAAILSELVGPIRTYTLVYPPEEETGGKQRDRQYARWISETYKTEHEEIPIHFSSYIEELPLILKAIEQPFSGYMTMWFAAKALSARGERMVITGDWGDELFGSYKAHRLAAEHPNLETAEVRYSTCVFTDSEKAALFSAEHDTNTLAHLKGYCAGLAATDPVNRMLETEFRSFFPGQTLMAAQVLSSAWGVLLLCPWSHTASYVARLAGDLKIRDGETKYIEKRLAERYLPEEIVYRPKEGFVTPTMPMLLALEGWVRRQLSLTAHGLFRADYVQELVDDFYREPEERSAYQLWALVCFNVWYDGYAGKL